MVLPGQVSDDQQTVLRDERGDRLVAEKLDEMARSVAETQLGGPDELLSLAR